MSARRTITLGLASLAVACSALPALAAGRSSATSRVSFGALLTKHSQPNGSFGCKHVTGKPGSCTRVEALGYNRPDDAATAPKTGTLTQVRLVAMSAGSFRLDIARAKPRSEQARIVKRGPVISYKGQPSGNSETFRIETFAVDLPIQKGDYLAIDSRSTSLLSCTSGGPAQLVFSPELKPSTTFTKASGIDDCRLLLEGIEKY